MRVLVTGGGGFLGTAVVNYLNQHGHEAIVFDRSHGYDILTDPMPGANHVIHMAGVLGTDELFDTPELAIDVNIKGTLNVLRWCQQWDAGYTDIMMPPVFPSVYTATKMCSAHLAKAWHVTYGVPVSHVRAFNAFGSGQKHGDGHPRKIIPAFSTEAWTGVPLKIWGDGEQTVDLIHANDLAHLLVDAIRFGDGETFDGGTGRAFTVNEVADMVLDIAGVTDRHNAIDHQPMRRGETPTTIVAEGEGWDLLDWKPQFRYDDLAYTVQWYKPA